MDVREDVEYIEEQPDSQQQAINQQQMAANNPYNYAVYPNKDQTFLQWLFDFRKEAIAPLRHVWRGEEYDFNSKTWVPSSANLRIMNEIGITWAISQIESYMNPAFIVTDLDEKTYHARMRIVSKIIINNVFFRWKEFGINKKTDIERVVDEIESKICAVLRGALDNGYRDFFSTQNQNIETRNLSPMEQQRRPGVFSSMAGMFKRMEKNQNERG